MTSGRPAVAVVHDYLTQRGGAERVVLAMLEAFPEAPLYTSLYDPKRTFAEFAALDVRTGPLDRIALLRRRHRLALPFLAPAFSSTQVDADVALCSSTGWAHGVNAAGRKLVYCNSPAKWLYAPDRYFADGRSMVQRSVRAVRRPLVRWDQRAAASADRYLVNSTFVAGWVQEVYGIEAEVLPCPHTVDVNGPSEPAPGLEAGFMLCVARLMPYKNVGAVVRAFADLPDERLVVVGTGPGEAALRAVAGPSVRFLGRVTDAQLRWTYQNCAGMVSASREDFGLTPLEAAAFGRPVAVLRWGGHIDTVVEGSTGVFFDDPEPTSVARAVRELRSVPWDEAVLRAHADTFSQARFAGRLREVVAELAAA